MGQETPAGAMSINGPPSTRHYMSERGLSTGLHTPGPFLPHLIGFTRGAPTAALATTIPVPDGRVALKQDCSGRVEDGGGVCLGEGGAGARRGAGGAPMGCA